MKKIFVACFRPFSFLKLLTCRPSPHYLPGKVKYLLYIWENKNSRLRVPLVRMEMFCYGKGYPTWIGKKILTPFGTHDECPMERCCQRSSACIGIIFGDLLISVAFSFFFCALLALWMKKSIFAHTHIKQVISIVCNVSKFQASIVCHTHYKI